mmetsp:Transcript_26962/g.74370  ORF Transcript_26962/g.74370 Transcript_26962/m.74370 type:complete len:269 (+) Transcript_26962:659-1465(+)
MFAHLAVGGRFGRLLRIIVIFFGRRTTGPFRVVAIHAAIPLGRQLFFVHDTPQSSPFPALVAFDPRGIGRARGLTKNGSAIAIQIFFAHEVADNVTVGRSRSSGSRSIAQSRRGNRTCGGQGGHVTIGTTVTGGRHGGAGSFEGYLFLAALLFVVIVIVVAAGRFRFSSSFDGPLSTDIGQHRDLFKGQLRYAGLRLRELDCRHFHPLGCGSHGNDGETIVKLISRTAPLLMPFQQGLLHLGQSLQQRRLRLLRRRFRRGSVVVAVVR